MLDKLHANKKAQLVLGLMIGTGFGFLLQKGGVTRYEVIMGQLMLYDWTVAKVILTAILTGMLGIYLMRIPGWVRLHKKKGSIGSTVIGSVIFGVGFGLLGYCPGTTAGAVGQGNLDALFGGVLGMLIGTGLYAVIYEKLNSNILHLGEFGDATLPQLLKARSGYVILSVGAAIVAFLMVLELAA